MARLAGAKLHGADKTGTREFVFEPNPQAVANVLGAPPGLQHTADTTTAGSCMLLVQVSLPVLLFGQGDDGLVHVSYKGGTNASNAPPFDYFEKILLPHLTAMSIPIPNVYVKKRGFFPRGGGVVEFEVQRIKAIAPLVRMDRGDLVSITGVAWVAGKIPITVAQRLENAARKALKKEIRGIPIEIEVRQMTVHEALGDGTGIDLVATTSTGCILGAGALGQRGVPAEQVGAQAAEALLEETREPVTVDIHLCDQLIVFAALAAGRSMWRARMSMHTRTAIHFVSMLSGARVRFTPIDNSQETEPVENKVYDFVVDGVGYQRGVGPTLMPGSEPAESPVPQQ